MAASPVVVLFSEDIKQPPRAEHVVKLLHHVAAELNVVRRELPHIVVFYVGRAAADIQNLPKATIAVEAGVSPGHRLYHVWIVDDVRDSATAEGLVMVLNDNFNLKMRPEKIRESRDRACHALAGTVDYHALAEGK